LIQSAAQLTSFTTKLKPPRSHMFNKKWRGQCNTQWAKDGIGAVQRCRGL